jgi:NTP pyrophosphatase (non-canonical NTP hydrolase)
MEQLTLNEYQKKAMTTCMESSDNMLYMMMGLCEEVGELQGKFSKGIRKKHIEATSLNNFRCFDMEYNEYEEWLELVQKEVGDVLWMVAGFCNVMGWSLEEVAKLNLDKLAARKAVGTIDGNGDGIIREK